MINNAMAALTREVEGQPNTPLSVCVAMSQAYIGYDFQNALHEELLNLLYHDLRALREEHFVMTYKMLFTKSS